MVRTVVAGLDGSPESRAAVDWAAREARMRSVPLKIVHVHEPTPPRLAQAPFLAEETRQDWGREVPPQVADAVRREQPGLEVTIEGVEGRAPVVLTEQAGQDGLLVLGSRGLGGISGFIAGSVGLGVIAHAEHPVVLVRAGESAVEEHLDDPSGGRSDTTPYRPVVVGVDPEDTSDAVLEFAFESAARRSAPLRAVQGYSLPAFYEWAGSVEGEAFGRMRRQQSELLERKLAPWRAAHPRVEVIQESEPGKGSVLLADASRNASLVVVGHRLRRHTLGLRIGAVAHAVLHHAVAPVAVVPHP
ncbi:universal stress protein [Streptomyces abyssomicinicus]|uniref:universal stress protein n=1 Tax=Streptomyces abyssomicinicus TaxID=574929 RepID=UPI00124FB8D3|nr:universal stress protein [Streptomyces abyssomicinicus]